MVKVKYYGHSCFIIDFDGYKIAIDPYNGVPGYKKLSVEANEVLCSHEHEDHNYTEGVKIIKGIKPENLHITEIDSFHDSENGKLRGKNKLRIFEYDKIRIMHCGDIGVMPTDDQIKLMHDLNVVMIPVGGYYTIEPDECKDFIERINPKAVIPMHYRKDGYGYDVIGTVDEFTKYFDNVDYLYDKEIEITDEINGKVIILNV